MWESFVKLEGNYKNLENTNSFLKIVYLFTSAVMPFFLLTTEVLSFNIPKTFTKLIFN